jgi:bacteriophage N4 adsorption protein B
MTFLDWTVVVLAGFYIVFAIDDLIFDVTYWIGRLAGWWHRERVEQAVLDAEPQRKIALVIPAWDESEVIGGMLTYNLGRIDYERFDVWVGTYANDPATQAEVARVAAYAPQVRWVVTEHDGPTSKADCMNTIVDGLRQHEAAVGELYDLLIMHDPEDIVHPLEFKLQNWHFAREAVDFVQLPVLSTAPEIYDFVAGTYIDEFAEMYAKNMYVRQRLTPFVPSAGVATTMRRSALEELIDETGGLPFATNSLTEDYDLGLKMAIAGRRTQFLAQEVRITEENGKSRDELIATWAPFPHTFSTAVRQRTRWMSGIVFQAWEHWKWPGPFGLKWVLAHDRRGPLGYLVVLFGYLLVLALVSYTWVRAFYNPDLPPILQHPAFGVLFFVGLFIMGNRLLQRAIAVNRFYGPGQALLAVFRTPFSNLVNMVAAFRAAWRYWYSQATGKPMTWDKTAHAIPPVVARQMRLGERLVLAGRITPQQLMLALGAQRQSPSRQIGQILVDQGAVSERDLRSALEG